MRREPMISPDGKWYCNYSGRIIASMVYLADGADEAAWVLIDEAEKQRLEAEWEKEEEPIPPEDEATAEDYRAGETNGR